MRRDDGSIVKCYSESCNFLGKKDMDVKEVRIMAIQ